MAGETINQVKSMLDWLKEGNRPIGYLSENTIKDIRKTLKVMYKLEGKGKNLITAPWVFLQIVEGKVIGIDGWRSARKIYGDLVEFFKLKDT